MPNLEPTAFSLLFHIFCITQAFKREKKRALMENQDAFAAQAEAMADRIRKQADVSLKKVIHGPIRMIRATRNINPNFL